jgi:Fuc2NAc and GlcNAc transferase
MDGINGIAGVEAVTVCLGGLLLYVVAVGWVPEIHGPLLLGASVLGFLVWNFPRARIFLGDVGSGFIGVMLGVLSIQAAWIAPELFWGWVILIGAFVVDANVTLFRRVWRGETFYEAHRSHAYQYAARRFGSHVPVTLAVGAINLFWLLPLAVLVAMGLLEGIVGVFIAYGLLIVLCYRFKAGARELQEV